jgi:hypothetical protein
MAPKSSTPSQSAASYFQIVTKENKDGAHKQHSSPACCVIFSNCYKRKQRWCPKAALQPSAPRHILKLLQKKTKMAPISSTPAQAAASYSQLVTKEKTKTAHIRSTPAQAAASYSQLVTTENKDGAHKQHSSPGCRVIFPISYKRKNKYGTHKKHSSPVCRVMFPNCYKRKQRRRPKAALHAQPAASYSQIVTKENKDGAHRQHSIPLCRVTFPASYNRKRKQSWRTEEALVSKVC